MKRTWTVVALVIFFLSNTVFAKDTVKLYGKKIPSETHFGIQLSGSINEPVEMLADIYAADDKGFTFGISLVTTPEGQSNLNLKTVSLVYSRDSFNMLKSAAKTYNLGSTPKATISGIQVRSHEDVPIVWTNSFGLSLFKGNCIGGGRFSLDDQIFKKLGESTLTELEHENDMNQLFYGTIYGVHLTGLKHVSLELSYDQMSVERAWMVWHQMVSTIAYGFASEAVPEIADLVLSDNITSSMPFNVLALLIKAGVSYYLYDWDYAHHNWPYSGDDPPLHYTRTTLTLNIYF